jgi:cold shock CspA family protein
LPKGIFDTIQEGQEMEFEIENDVRGRGQRATDVELINNAFNAQR